MPADGGDARNTSCALLRDLQRRRRCFSQAAYAPPSPPARVSQLKGWAWGWATQPVHVPPSPPRLVKASTTQPAVLVLCADLRHTQGAAEYAFLSFISLAVRLRTVVQLPMEVQVPRAAPHLSLDELFTNSSMAELARANGFAWRPPGRTPCGLATSCGSLPPLRTSLQPHAQAGAR